MTGASGEDCTKTFSFECHLQTVLSPQELELYEFTKLCGIDVEPTVFKMLVELLKMDIAPSAVFSMVQSMTSQASKTAQTTKRSSQTKTSQTTGKKPPVAAKPKKNDSQ